MKKSELTIFTKTDGKDVEVACNSKKLAISLIDNMYRLSEEIVNQVAINGLNIEAELDYVLDEKLKREKFQTEHKAHKKYSALIYAYIALAAVPRYIEDENYAEAMEALFLANTIFAAHENIIVSLNPSFDVLTFDDLKKKY